MSGKRILTVTYGTFSCTLEGFDDAFGTMKAITQYFRELSAEDRYFGAIPPQPDPQMLREIAERETNRRIEARVDGESMVLRPRGGPASARATVSAGPAAAPAAPSGAGGESVAARLARIRAMAARQREAAGQAPQSIFSDDEADETAHLAPAPAVLAAITAGQADAAHPEAEPAAGLADAPAAAETAEAAGTPPAEVSGAAVPEGRADASQAIADPDAAEPHAEIGTADAADAPETDAIETDDAAAAADLAPAHPEEEATAPAEADGLDDATLAAPDAVADPLQTAEAEAPVEDVLAEAPEAAPDAPDAIAPDVPEEAAAASASDGDAAEADDALGAEAGVAVEALSEAPADLAEEASSAAGEMSAGAAAPMADSAEGADLDDALPLTAAPVLDGIDEADAPAAQPEPEDDPAPESVQSMPHWQTQSAQVAAEAVAAEAVSDLPADLQSATARDGDAEAAAASDGSEAETFVMAAASDEVAPGEAARTDAPEEDSLWTQALADAIGSESRGHRTPDASSPADPAASEDPFGDMSGAEAPAEHDGAASASPTVEVADVSGFPTGQDEAAVPAASDDTGAAEATVPGETAFATDSGRLDAGPKTDAAEPTVRAARPAPDTAPARDDAEPSTPSDGPVHAAFRDAAERPWHRLDVQTDVPLPVAADAVRSAPATEALVLRASETGFADRQPAFGSVSQAAAAPRALVLTGPSNRAERRALLQDDEPVARAAAAPDLVAPRPDAPPTISDGGARISSFPAVRPGWARDGEGPLHKPRNHVPQAPGAALQSSAGGSGSLGAVSKPAPPAPEGKVEDELRKLLRVLGVAGEETETAADVAAPGAEDAPTRSEPEQGETSARGRAILEAVERGLLDDDIERIAASIHSRLAEAETIRRQAAISHLKAAVAATEADRVLGGDDEGPDSPMDRYRDDLTRAVLTREADDAAARAARPAPLVLGAPQMVSRPDAMHKMVPSNLLSIAQDDDDGEDEAPAQAVPALSFADFVRTVEPGDLPDLFEAAAAYLAVHERRSHFSRPQIMRKVAMVADEVTFSREEGLRSFGALLRQGRLEKLNRGQFTLSPKSRFRHDHDGPRH